MGLFSSLFSQKGSTKPEDYEALFVRWDRDGKEYGPLQFADLLLRDWSGPPMWGRFEGESKWRDYSHFLKILDQLDASLEQITFLKAQGIEIEVGLSFKRALNLVELREGELREIRAVERKAKEKLPATKHIRKKMDGYGIDYPEDVTRAQAKELLALYEEEQELLMLRKNLAKKGIVVQDSVISAEARASHKDNMSIVDHLDNLVEVLDQLDQLKIDYNPPVKSTWRLCQHLTKESKGRFLRQRTPRMRLRKENFWSTAIRFGSLVNYLKGRWMVSKRK